MRSIKQFSVVFLLVLTAYAIPEKKKITVFLAGDSTVCYYEPSRAPVTGWGMPFAGFFDSSVQFDNRARGGRSTRTFISENRWRDLAGALREGDYVFIQFGHNDEAREEKYKDRYTPVQDYAVNLIRFVEETRSRRATPVLVTPVTRRRFDKDGNIQETHAEYTAAMCKVARDYNVALIDLDRKSRELLQQLGPEHSGLLFMNLEPGEHPNYPQGQKDNTHFNEYGARRIAQLVLAGVRELKLDLADRIIANKKVSE